MEQRIHLYYERITLFSKPTTDQAACGTTDCSADGLYCFPRRLRHRDDRCDATVFCIRFVRIRRVGERIHSGIIIIIMRAGRQGQCDFVQAARRFFHFVNPRIPVRKRACKIYLLMRICATDKSHELFR